MRRVNLFFFLYWSVLISSSLAQPISTEIKANHETKAAKLISLNFQKVEVRSILQLLAEFTGNNIIVSEAVKGNMTVNLQNIPWKQALHIILTTQALEKKEIGNIIYVAPVEELKQKEEKLQKAQLAIENSEPIRSETFTLNYAKATDIVHLLQDKTQTFLSNRGKVTCDTRTNTIWVQDIKSNLVSVKKALNKLDIPVAQVMIEARIVNVTKDFARDLGLHFKLAKKEAKQANTATEGLFSSASSLIDKLNFDMGGSSAAHMGLALAKLGNGILLDLELSALESEGRGEVISRPQLIVTNQQPAVIESGEEIPYQETASSGATAVSFKKAVLSLKVTPQINPTGQILLSIKINQDIPTSKIFNGVPTILTKEIQTNVLAENGQTIVLGGIYKQDKIHETNRVLFLGYLPILRKFFTNHSLSIRNEELLIFITPRIIASDLKTDFTSEG